MHVTLGLIFVASHRKEWPMTCIAVRCPPCQSDPIVKRGKTARGTQRDLCQHTLCTKGSFLLDYWEMDEMWSFVGNKGNLRWLWHAIDHHPGKVLAYVFGRRKEEVCLRLKARLEPCELTRSSTDYWGAYTRHLDPDEHCPGKRHTQKIERKHLPLRTRMKRLARKTICFAKTTQMPDLVIGLFVNRYAFGWAG